MDVKKYKDLAFINGVSSFERNVHKFLEENLKNKFNNEIIKDGIGSLIVKRNTKKSNIKLMFATHMDEVGFVVQSFHGKFLKLKPIGSFWTHLVAGQLYTLINNKGVKYHGIISSPATHGRPDEEKLKTISIEDVYLDLGIEEEDIKLLEIEIGNQVCPYCPDIDTATNKTFISKAMDNRISSYIGLELMSQNLDNKNELNWAFTVQEEPGLRGARTTTDIVHPDVALAIDTTLAGDTLFDKNPVSLGGGVVLSFIDSNSIAHRGLMRWIENLCDKNDIKYQYAVFNKGGTDSGNIHKAFEGVINISLSVPVRYMHTNYTIANTSDVDYCIKLAKLIIENLDEEQFKIIKEM